MASPDTPIDPQRLRRLLRRLLSIYSPTGKEEEAVDYLFGYLRRRGLPVVRQSVDENRDNLIVAADGAEAPVVFIGHVDTVTAHDLENFGPEEKGDRIVALGAADMKGGCAAMIEAVAGLWERFQPRLPVALALVVGEEEDGDGALRLVKDYHFPWAVVGEATNLKPCLSHYGYLGLDLTVRGEMRHASLALKGQNATEHMLKILLGLIRHLEQHRPDLVYNVRDLFSGQAGFTVPDECGAWLDVHMPPLAPVAEITMEIEEIIERDRRAVRSPEVVFHFDTVHAGYEIPARGPVVEAMKTALETAGLPWETDRFPSHSDANVLWNAGYKPIVFGPGQLETAHRPDEAVSFNQVLTAARIYYQTGLGLLNDPC